MADSRQDMAEVQGAGAVEGKVTCYGGTDVRLAHPLPGKPAEGHVPHSPFDKPSRVEPFWYKD